MPRPRRRIAGFVAPLAGLLALAGAPQPAAAGLDYATFARQIREKGIRSAADAVALLPPELRINYTLMYHSRSIQQGSLENPRVLLFGTDAKLIVTFNGEPGQTGYDKLEILHFDDASETFELRSIDFKESVEFSEANPKVCTACHRPEPQPIWKDYGSPNDPSGHGQWPGSYGPSHDFVPEHLRPPLEAFWKAAAQHPLYRHLLRDPESDLFPYQPTGSERRWQHRFRPNNRMSRLIARLNARRVARAIQQSALFQERKHLVLSWFLECDEWGADPRLADEVHRLFASRFPETANAALHADLANVRQEEAFVIPFMLEKLLTGLDVYQWNMSVVTPPANRYHEGIHTIDQLIAGRLLEHVSAQDPALAPFYRPVTFEKAYGNPLYAMIEPGGAIWPGELGDLYDRSGVYHDRALAKQACGVVVPRARAELAAPDGAPRTAAGPATPDARAVGL